MMLAIRRPCPDHRAALYAYVDRREIEPGTAAALHHLDHCRDCEQELADVALAVHALGRLRRELETLEPPGDAWLRLRDRVTRQTSPWRWRASLGGLATSSLLVAVLVLPTSLSGLPASALGEAPPSPDVERRVEAEYLASIRTGTLPATPRVVHGGGSAMPMYPPEIAQVRKEVPAAPATGRSSQPI